MVGCIGPGPAFLASGAPLFFVGTLMDRDILSAVLGRPARRLRREDAVLKGFAVRRADGESYPILVEAAGREAHGVLIYGLSEQDLARLAYYESDDYALESRLVSVNGRTRLARMFTATGRLQDSGEAWDAKAWAKAHKAEALYCAEKLMSHYGVLDSKAAAALWDGIRAEALAVTHQTTKLKTAADQAA